MSVKTIIHGVERIEVTPIRRVRSHDPMVDSIDRKLKIYDASGNKYVLHLFSTMAHALIAQEVKGEPEG